MSDTVVTPGGASLAYAHKFYELMVERAKLETIQGSFDVDIPEPVEVLVFRGKLTDIFVELKVSQKYYVTIRKILREYDCVQYLQRGTKAYDSIVILNHPPPEEISPLLLTDSHSPAKIADVERRVTALEDWRVTTAGGINIGEALRNMETRLAKLERRES
jgi:hypothetical protein